MSKKINKNFIIPIFIPNQGCPHRCIFCQQKTITNKSEALPSPQDIIDTIEIAIKSKRLVNKNQKEVAFFGGTFTSLPNEVMEEMLAAVYPYIKQGILHSIRISTRPDSLSEEKLNILDSFMVKTVELGIQSMDDHVLALSNRGHTSKDTANAVKILRERDFNIGAQLMPGLPGDSTDLFLRTIEKVINLKPNFARLYPTLVIKGTILEQWYNKGKYSPMGLDTMVSLCKDACLQLENAGIPVIRIGLMSSPSLLEKGEIVAGPWHPSFGFLVRSAIYLERLKPRLPIRGDSKNITLRIHPNEIPLLIGHKKSGIKQIETITDAVINDIISDDSVTPGVVYIHAF
ncbi:MAG: radical SAM protein [Deltaproteobacteria bacterium]|nr:radical SAM protein [Deltaproteobacteria bacterium]